MFGINIKVLWESDDADGETCKSCGKEIKGTKYVMFVEMPPNPPQATDNVLCVLCKIASEND